MAKSLVVVESPAKAKTINKYLGRNYKVVASMGHVRDLPKSKLGVAIEDLEAGVALRVIDLPTLIELKEKAGRPKDLAALPVLKATLVESRRRS